LIAAARQDDRVAVRQLFGEARATADRLGQDRNDFWTAFGPTNVALHEVSTAVELGDAGEVVRKGEALDPSRFPPGLLGRRAQVFIDLARGYTQQRKDAAAVNMLLEAERIAPEAVRYQVIVKEMLRELLRRERAPREHATVALARSPGRHHRRERFLKKFARSDDMITTYHRDKRQWRRYRG
jgi:hypothetical protein